MSVYRNSVLFARFLEIICPGGGVLAQFFSLMGGAFELSLSPGVEEFVL